VYIDAGEFGLIEPQPRNVFLIGDTRATIRCSETQLYRVFVMHGAKATINASGFAVVKTEIDRDKHSNISISTYGHSRAL
jgi:predicted transcriptional regulator of viral defense system